MMMKGIHYTAAQQIGPLNIERGIGCEHLSNQPLFTQHDNQTGYNVSSTFLIFISGSKYYIEY